MSIPKFNIQTIIFSAIFVLISQTAIAGNNDEGQQLFSLYCDACHGMSGGMDMRKRTAPPIAAVRMHYIGRHPDKASFVNAVSSWLEKQDPAKSLMRGAIRHFKLMPPIAVNRQDAIKIANYIYEGNLQVPPGMVEHVQSQHKNNGMNLNR